LLDYKGYLRAIDFGMAKFCKEKTNTVCGIPEYLAPEVLLNLSYGKEVDWWSFGCFIYELLVGVTPFFDDDPVLIFKKILKGELKFPSNFPASAKSPIKHCLERDVGKRYGCLSKGVADIKGHRFFMGFDWSGTSKQKAKQIFVPNLNNNDDLTLLNIINDEEEEVPTVNPVEDPFAEWIKKNN
jgi:protein kinase A